MGVGTSRLPCRYWQLYSWWRGGIRLDEPAHHLQGRLDASSPLVGTCSSHGLCRRGPSHRERSRVVTQSTRIRRKNIARMDHVAC